MDNINIPAPDHLEPPAQIAQAQAVEQRITQSVESVKAAVEDKVSKVERNLKAISSLGLGVVIAFLAWQYISSENKISNAFIREEFVEQSKAAASAQTDNATATRELISAIRESNKQQEFDRQQLSAKLDSLIDAQKDTAKALEDLVPGQLEQPQPQPRQ